MASGRLDCRAWQGALDCRSVGSDGHAMALCTRPLGTLAMSSEIDSPRKRLEFIFGETALGNGQPFLDALAEDAEWTVIGSTGWSRTYRGKPQILSDLIAPLRRVLASPRKSHAFHMIAEGNMVAV